MSHQLTDTEKIAVALFGWVADKRTRGYKWTRYTRQSPIGVVICHDDGIWTGSEDWPNITDWNWIRKMEDAIAERDLNLLYAEALYDQTGNVAYATMLDGAHAKRMSSDALTRLIPFACGIRATAAQRVAAAVKVLEGGR